MKKAEQVWLETDVMDYIDNGCKWAEVEDKIMYTHNVNGYMSIGGTI